MSRNDSHGCAASRARTGLVHGLAAVALGATAALAAPRTPQPSSLASSEGSAGNHYVYGFQPLAVQDPIEAWRLDYEEVHSEALADGTGIAYVVASDKRGRYLLALWIETGELLARAKLKKGGRAHLSLWDGGVLFADEAQMETYALQGDKLKKGKTIRGPWAGEPVVHGRWAFSNDAKRKAHVIDLEKGKSIEDGKGGYGQLGVVMTPNGDSVTVTGLDYGTPAGSMQTGLIKRQARFSGLLEGKKLEVENLPEEFLAAFEAAPKKDDMATCGLVRWEAGGAAGWFITTPMTIKAQGGRGAPAMLFNESSKAGGIWDVALPVAWNAEAGEFYLVTNDGVCRRVQPSGGSVELKNKDYMPEEFVPGPVSACGGVMHAGNMAIAVANGEILYLLEDANADLRITPVADAQVIYGTLDGDIVCLADPAHMAAVAAAAEAAASPIHKYRGVHPDEGDGIILDTGQLLPGEVDLHDDGGASVTLPSGEELDFNPGRVLAAVVGGKRRELDSRHQFGWFAVWRNALLREHCEKARAQFDTFLELHYLDDCERMIAELERLHADPRTMDEWFDAVARVRPGEKGKESKRESARNAERKQNERTMRALVEAGKWAIEEEMPLAATALLDLADQIIGGDEEVGELAKGLVQPGFPWAERRNSTRLWMRWAAELLPASGEFVHVDDPARESWAGTEWEEAIAVRSPNVTLVCKDEDPAAIGSLLRYAEGGVRALREVLPLSAENAAWLDDDARLEVRVHRNRREYLDEKSPDGEPFAMPWSAGFYSPGDQVSRFYLERDQVTNEIVLGSLNQVLVHELTHHYIDLWWAPGARGGTQQPGYWIVEGFARFVEDQVAELGTGEETTWNRTDAGCVQASIGYVTSQRAIAAADIVDLRQVQFAELDDELRGVFYEEAGALVFYLFNQCGPEVRQKLVDYAQDYYNGVASPSGWERLGFETATLLQDGFFTWLRALAS